MIRDNYIEGGLLWGWYLYRYIYIQKCLSFTKIKNLSLSITNAFDIVTIRLHIGDTNKSVIIVYLHTIYKQHNMFFTTYMW